MAAAAAAPSARREDIVRGWADLPLFTAVFAGQRDDDVTTAGVLPDALIEVARSGRADDFRATGFDTIRDVRRASPLRCPGSSCEPRGVLLPG